MSTLSTHPASSAPSGRRVGRRRCGKPSPDSNSPVDCLCLARSRATGPARPARPGGRLHRPEPASLLPKPRRRRPGGFGPALRRAPPCGRAAMRPAASGRRVRGSECCCAQHSTAAERQLAVARSLGCSSGSQTCRPTASRPLDDSTTCQGAQSTLTWRCPTL